MTDESDNIASNASTNYQFTADWFALHARVWDSLIGRLMPTKILEIGSYEGRAASYLIEKCAAAGPIEIYCVDTWEGSHEHDKRTMPSVERRFDHNVMVAVQQAPHPVSFRKLKKPSIDALATLIATDVPQFDLIYIDGSHQATDVLADAVLGFQLLRIGGIMIFDDYYWHEEPAGKQDFFNMPKPAIDAFVNIFQRKLQFIGGLPNYQVYLEKISR